MSHNPQPVHARFAAASIAIRRLTAIIQALGVTEDASVVENLVQKARRVRLIIRAINHAVAQTRLLMQRVEATEVRLERVVAGGRHEHYYSLWGPLEVYRGIMGCYVTYVLQQEAQANHLLDQLFDLVGDFAAYQVFANTGSSR